MGELTSQLVAERGLVRRLCPGGGLEHPGARAEGLARTEILTVPSVCWGARSSFLLSLNFDFSLLEKGEAHLILGALCVTRSWCVQA